MDSFQQAEQQCHAQGARLLEPRDTETFEYFKRAEKEHLLDPGFFPYADIDNNYLAIGLYFAAMTGQTTKKFYFR